LALLLAMAPCIAWPQPTQGFQAHILIVRSADELVAWIQKPPAERGGDVGRLRKVEVGQRIYFPMVATGLAPPASGEMRLTADFELRTPTGAVAYSKKGLGSAVIVNRPDMTTVELGPIVDVVVESGDAKGVYQVTTVISDGTQSATATETFRFEGPAEKTADKPAASPAPKAAAPRLDMGDPPKANPGKDRDKRDCLTLPTPAEVIKCTERKK
jgi:hypothetical protein